MGMGMDAWACLAAHEQQTAGMAWLRGCAAGQQKCGTSSLWNYLTKHPLVRSTRRASMQFWRVRTVLPRAMHTHSPAAACGISMPVT